MGETGHLIFRHDDPSVISVDDLGGFGGFVFNEKCSFAKTPMVFENMFTKPLIYMNPYGINHQFCEEKTAFSSWISMVNSQTPVNQTWQRNIHVIYVSACHV